MTAVAKAMIVRGLVSALFSANPTCFFQMRLCLKVGDTKDGILEKGKNLTVSDTHLNTVSSRYLTFAIHPGVPRMRCS